MLEGTNMWRVPVKAGAVTLMDQSKDYQSKHQRPLPVLDNLAPGSPLMTLRIVYLKQPSHSTFPPALTTVIENPKVETTLGLRERERERDRKRERDRQ